MSFDPFSSGLATAAEFDPFTDGLAAAWPSKANPDALEKLFSGVDGMEAALPPDVSGELNSALYGEADGRAAKLRAANVAYLSDAYSKPIEEVTRHYEHLRNVYAADALHWRDTLDDAGFYSKVGEHLRRRKLEGTMLAEMAHGLFQSIRKGEDFNAAFEQQRKARWTTPAWDAFRQDYYRQVAKQNWDALGAARRRLESPIANVSAYMQFAKRGAAPGEENALSASRVRALDALRALPGEEADMVLDFAASNAVTATDRTSPDLLEKTARRVERGVTNFAEQTFGTAQELGRRFLMDEGTATRSRRDSQLERKLQQRISGEVDPLKGGNWLTNGLLNAAESTPRMIASFNIPGLVANFAATKEDLRGQYEDKGISAGNADIMAGIAAIPYTAINFLQAKMVFGGEIPGLSKFLAAPAAKLTDVAIRGFVAGSVELGEQFGQEQLQNLTAPTVQALGSHLSESIPGVEWDKELKSMADSSPETIAALLPFVLVGAGRASFKDRAYGKEYLQREGFLRAVGLSADAVSDVMEAKTPEEAGAIIQAEWPRRATGEAQQNALEELDLQAMQARQDAGHVWTDQDLGLIERYPEIFHSIPANHIPIEIERADGTVVPAALNGYYDSPLQDGVSYASVGYKTESGWSHGVIGFGADTSKILTPVPTAEEWNQGIRSVTRAASVTRAQSGEYVVTSADGSTVGTATTPEFAAQIVQEHLKPKAADVDISTPGAALDARGQAAINLSVSEPKVATLEASVFNSDLPNKATIATKRQSGLTGSIAAPRVIESLANILTVAGERGNQMLRFGRTSKVKNALGYYAVKERLIRVRTANDIETAAHEVAHAMEDALFGIGNVWQPGGHISAADVADLTTLGKQLYSQKKPQGGWESEGFAEFFRLYVTDPEQSQAKAPSFFKAWTEHLMPDHPDVQAAVKTAQNDAMTFYRQGSLERARQGIAAQPSRFDVANEAIQGQLDSARRKWTEAAQPIADFVAAAREEGATIPQEDDPYANLVARRQTADAVAAYMATEGMLDFAGNVTGKPLQDAFELVGKERSEDFVIYLWAKRAEALWNDPRGPRNPGLAKIDAEELLKELHSPEFAQAAQIVYDWNNGVLEYAAQASPDYRQAVSKIRDADPGFYIPLFREFKALDDRYSGRGGPTGKNLSAKLKGSGRRIKDPIESMLAQAKATVLKAHQKAILDQIVRIAETTPGMGSYVTEVPPEKIPHTAPQWQVTRALLEKLENQLGKDRAQDLGGAIEDALDGEVFTFFAPAIQPKQNEAPILPVYRGGKVRFYEMDPELYKSLSGMDLYRLPRALDLFLGMPARTFRMGTTGLRAAFSLVTNPLRDLRTLHMNSAASANPAELFGHWMSSLRDLAVHAVSFGKVGNEWSDLAKRLGVEMAGSLGQDTRPLQSAARKLKRGGEWSPVDMKDNMDLVRAFLQFPETATRLAEMTAVAKDMGWDPSQPLTPAIAAKLATAGKQVTTDFTQAGEYARVINQAIPFFNASIQGPVAHLRALQRDPTKFVFRGLQGAALALALWYQNKDEEWWKEMNSKERFLFSYFKVGRELIRIPRSYEADGVFMAFTEALADSWYQKEPRRAAEWFGPALSQISQIDIVSGVPVPPLPVLPKLLAEQLSNRDFFFDRPIVPRGELEHSRPAEQYNEFSSTVAINLGEILNVSPRRIDFSIRNVFGGVGADLVSMAGSGGTKEPTTRDVEMADIPVIGVLFQRGGAVPKNPESIDRLYDAYEESLHIQYSKRQSETPTERQVRLMLADAVKAQTALALVERELPSRGKRQEVQALRIGVAKAAVQMAIAGEVDRSPNRRILAEAKRELAELQSDNGRRVLPAE